MSSKVRHGRTAFYAEPMPKGFYFDPYMGDIGALRLADSQMKVADEVDRVMAELLAWSIVTPALRTLEGVSGQWDQAGRLWGHEWRVVAWMALAADDIRIIEGGKVTASCVKRSITSWVTSDDPRDRMVYKGLG